jgi:hypothetical protein
MRVLVGTLYSGENEFDECVAAIQRQTFKDFDHIIIRDLPKREAHRKLFTHFLDRKDTYGLLIKVDADTVIISDTLFEGIVEKFNRNDWLHCMNIAVLGFFTGLPIAAGIQIYRNTVRWDFEKETLFTDTPEDLAGRYLYDQTDLAPAAYHNKNPSPLQAFHYGVHRGLKSIARTQSVSHWKYLREVYGNFKRTGDVRIGLAVLGAELVYAGKLRKVDADYTNPGMKNMLRKYESMNSREIELEIRRLRAFNWGIMPGDLRRRLIRAHRGDSLLSDMRYEVLLFAKQKMHGLQERWRRLKGVSRTEMAGTEGTVSGRRSPRKQR